MNVILLSGGSGKRLWPLSNDIRSKQFLKIFRNENGDYESMLQRMYSGIRKTDPNARITIATAKNQISSIRHQLGTGVDISSEPDRRDTFPAIALATLYLKDVNGLSEEEAVVVCPVDPYVEEAYFKKLLMLYEEARKGNSNIVLMGVEPIYPTDKYGYIIPENRTPVSNVLMFREKPSVSEADQYIKQGALWNGGIFAFRLSYMVEKVRELLGTSDYYELYTRYSESPRISIDYALVEKEKNISVLRYEGQWKDLGTWNTLTESMSESIIGDARMDDTCQNVHVINELSIPMLIMGVKDAIVSASPDGILVADKNRSSYMKPYVDQIERGVMYAEKSWGTYHVLDMTTDSLTIKATLQAGNHMNYHSHECRDEIWTICSGRGRVVVDGMEQLVAPGDVITMQAGCRHMVFALTDLVLIEVQLGRDIRVEDKIKYEWNEIS